MRFTEQVAAAVLRGTAILLATQILTSLASYLILKLTRCRPSLRVIFLSLVAVAYTVVPFVSLSRREIILMGVIFALLHGAFSFRFLSSIYFHARRCDFVPGLVFHAVLLMCGPRAHYGAERWSDLDGRRFSWGLVREWGRHIAYEAILVVAAALFAWVWFVLKLPFWRVALGAAALILSLALFEFCCNLLFICWSFWGRFPGFFGRFAFFRAVHVGQWWQYWNVPGVVLFREFSGLLNLGNRRFANVMIVFATLGILHQIAVWYYTGRASYGALLSFLLHGILIYVFTPLYRQRKKIPVIPRLLIFNPATSALVSILAALPFVLDFSGHFTFSG